MVIGGIEVCGFSVGVEVYVFAGGGCVMIMYWVCICIGVLWVVD